MPRKSKRRAKPTQNSVRNQIIHKLCTDNKDNKFATVQSVIEELGHDKENNILEIVSELLKKEEARKLIFFWYLTIKLH